MTARKRAAGWAIGFAAVLLVSGCVIETNTRGPGFSSGVPANCQVGNWYDVGFQDGSNWDAGIANHCTEENGFVAAASGSPHLKTCPRSIAKGFKRGRKLGRSVYKENQEIAERSEQLRVLDRNIQSGRFTPEQLERLLGDRRKVLKRLEKNQKNLTKLLNRARKRGYPLG